MSKFKPKEEVSDVAKLANAIRQHFINQGGLTNAVWQIKTVYEAFNLYILRYPAYHPLKAAEIVTTEIPLFYLYEVYSNIQVVENKEKVFETIFNEVKSYYDSTTNS